MTSEKAQTTRTRQLASLAASGGLIFYIVVILGLAVIGGVLFAIRLMGQ